MCVNHFTAQRTDESRSPSKAEVHVFNHSLPAPHHTFSLRHEQCIPCGSSDRGEISLWRFSGLCVADWQPPAAEIYCNGCLPSLCPQQWQLFLTLPYSSHQLPQSSVVKFEQRIPELFKKQRCACNLQHRCVSLSPLKDSFKCSVPKGWWVWCPLHPLSLRRSREEKSKMPTADKPRKVLQKWWILSKIKFLLLEFDSITPWMI